MIIFVVLTIFGLVVGSFINALVWRLHKQMSSKKTSQDKALSILSGRSMCVHCEQQLRPVDLIPVVSWLALKGKCRYCHKNISWQYPAVELLTAILFVVSLVAWPGSLSTPLEYGLLGLWLTGLPLAISLAIYDARWMILPNQLVYPFGLVAIVFTVTSNFSAVTSHSVGSALIGSIGFGGFFYLLYQLSKGKWIGGGDVRLGFVLGLLLGWQKSILCLTLAAYLGTLVVGVLVLLKKYHRKLKLPFGPFLLIAAYCAMLWGQAVIDWYMRISGL